MGKAKTKEELEEELAELKRSLDEIVALTPVPKDAEMQKIINDVKAIAKGGEKPLRSPHVEMSSAEEPTTEEPKAKTKEELEEELAELKKSLDEIVALTPVPKAAEMQKIINDVKAIAKGGT